MFRELQVNSSSLGPFASSCSLTSAHSGEKLKITSPLTRTRRPWRWTALEDPRTLKAHPERMGSSRDAREDLYPGLAELDPDRGRPDYVVCAKDLTLRIGAKTILSGVEIDIVHGTITAIIGPTATARASGPATGTCSFCAVKSG